jgi:glucose/mannose-6-phosphate isomerase
MREIILTIPAQLAAGTELGLAHAVVRPHRHIVSCGMGGSAIAGEMLSMVRDDVIVHWDYRLPVNTGAQDLVVCTSWSGDTEETISSYEAARKLGADTLVITTGGKLADMAKSDGSALMLLPQVNAVPRTNTGYMAGALFAALGMADRLPKSLDAAALETQGKELAGVIGPRMPVIYASYPWRKLTGFWKMAYSETAKRQVMVNWFPSGAHNEVVGWDGPYQDAVSFLFLRDAGDDAGYAKNFDALLAILGPKGYTVHNVALSGDTVLEKAFNSYIVSLWTGFYAARSLGTDPLATELLDEFKRKKANN